MTMEESTSSLLSSSSLRNLMEDHEDLDAPKTTTTCQYLFETLHGLVEPKLAVSKKLEKLEKLEPYLQEADAHVDLGSSGTVGILPPLDWNGRLRKSYSLFLWVRPVLVGPLEESQNKTDTKKEEEKTNHYQHEKRRILYRFSTSPHDDGGLGVCVTLGEWSRTNENQVQTTVTAFSLPHSSLSHSNIGKKGDKSTTTTSPIHHSTFVSCPLVLEKDQWSLIGITHVFPYLKRPQWTLCVNGTPVGSGELAYPVLDGATSKASMVMSYNTILANAMAGGVRDLLDENKQDDVHTPASELSQQQQQPRLDCRLHVLAIGLYGDVVPAELQAILSHAGPMLALQQEGRIVSLVPPVANATKGTTLDGRRASVGIPLMDSIEIQKLASKLYLGYAATSLLILRNPHHRIVLPCCTLVGETEATPKVGLLEPSNKHAEMEAFPLVLEGAKVKAMHTLSEFLLHHQSDEEEELMVTHTDLLQNAQGHFSLLLHEQGALACLVLPFFLALPPPGLVLQLQETLARDSLHHLYALYARDGALAAKLLSCLASLIQHGGARIHEEVLQSGLIHTLSCTLRRSLARALELDLLSVEHSNDNINIKDFLRHAAEKDATTGNEQDQVCPSYIPLPISQACAQLVRACCGSVKTKSLNVLEQVRKSSDLAMTCVFGLGLDLDLWGGHVQSACLILNEIAQVYGGPPPVATGLLHDVVASSAWLKRSGGSMLRSQVPVQFLLDSIKLRFDSNSEASVSLLDMSFSSLTPQEQEHIGSDKEKAVEQVGQSLSEILFGMLLASLMNDKVISQSEHDVAACMGALSDSPLGSMGGHVVLEALTLVLQWCDVLPEPRGKSLLDAAMEEGYSLNQEQVKSQVASRLGRNLLLGQYHDIIAPMLLSRTIFCGERNIQQQQQENNKAKKSDTNNNDLYLGWKRDWRSALLIFSWLTSIAGAEGEIAAKSTGSLLLASSLAGSLNGCLVSTTRQYQQRLVSCLFLPPPAMAALSVGGRRNDKSSWNYSDLLSDRLRVMMPLLPGLVVSLVSHPEDSPVDSKEPMDPASLSVLMELIAAVGGAFQRVYGGLDQMPKRKSRMMRRARRSAAAAQAIQAAKDYAPHLLVVLMVLENHIDSRRLSVTSSSPSNAEIEILSFGQRSPGNRSRSDSENEWVDLSTTHVHSTSTYGSAYKRMERKNFDDATLSKLSSCQSIVLGCLTDLIACAMKLGGAEASTTVWRGVISTLKESVVYSKKSTTKDETAEEVVESQRTKDNGKVGEALAQNVLCRLAAVVLTKAVTRENDAEIMWSVDLCSAVSRLCDLAEEKELLRMPMGVRDDSDSTAPYSRDQVLLMCAFLDIMAMGREVTGWCQLVLHPPPQRVESTEANFSESSDPLGGIGGDMPLLSPMKEQMAGLVDRVTNEGQDIQSPLTPRSRVSSSDSTPGASSKLLLPILQPCLRIVLGCVGNIRSSMTISIPQPLSATEEGPADSQEQTMKMSLLSHLANELRHSLTAAIVGLSFPNARDVALNALASLRRGLIYHQNAKDEDAVKICCFLFVAIAEEIRVRYDGERRLRDKALFDAYEDDQGEAAEENVNTEETKGLLEASARSSVAEEAESSRAVEQLILGGDLIPRKPASDKPDTKKETETVTFGSTEDGEAPPKSPAPSRGRLGGGSEDFVMFHETYETSDDASGQRNSATKMGWSHYKGLGSVLEKCSELAKYKAAEGQQTQVESMLSVLSSYLDTWDDSVAREAAESELVELFNESVNLDLDLADAPPLPLSPLGEKVQATLNSSLPALPVLGSETAADAMSNFIEFSSVEKSRLKEVASTVLPARRYSCAAFAERYCWAQYMEFVKDDGHMDALWERTTADGNRDVRSRLISMPCNPQFRRFIPAWLDHGASFPLLQEDGEGPTDKEGEDGLSSDLDRSTHRNSCGTDIDLSAAKKLAEAGDLEIVDITKKEIVEENDDIVLDVAIDDLDDPDVEGPTDFPNFSERSEDNVEEDIAENVKADEDKPIDEDAPEDAQTESAETKETPERESSIAELIEQHQMRSFHHHITSSPFSHPPDNSSSTLSLMYSSAAGMIDFHFDNCLHVKTEGSRKCAMLLSATHLILEFDAESEGLFDGEMMAVKEEAERQKMIEEAGGGPSEVDGAAATQEELEKRHRETAALRPRCIRFNISELSHVYLRRYRLRDSALEMFFIPSGGSSYGGFGLYAPATSLFLDFGPGYEGNARRDDAANAIMRRAPPQTIKQWPDRSSQFLHEQLSRLAMGWVEGRVTNFDYLLHLNILSGRSYNDLCQYPVMPWVLSNFHSEDLPDLSDRSNFRDLSKPMGALNPDRLADFIDRFETFSDPTIPPFMYGSHYSTSAGVVLHFLVRMHPFAGLHRQLQGGHFDVADRLFSSVPRTWDMCTGSSAAEVKELTPEWYCNPAFLKNTNKFRLGTSQEGELISDVVLPPWANGSPEKFVEVMRDALESDICSEMLPDWIDLIFGRKQQGPEAIKAHNVFFYLTYYGSVDVASIEDESLRTATELQIAHFGQCPMQLFRRPHVRRVQRWRNFRRLTFYQVLSAYTQGAGPSIGENEKSEEEKELMSPSLRKDGKQRIIGEPMFLPFFSAPLSHWVHLAAPPPGPHADLIAVRLAGLDRCLAVDAQGVFHTFRWAWKPEDGPPGEDGDDKASDKLDADLIDKGGFVAQRELPRFRTVPRIPHIPTKLPGNGHPSLPAVAISKTLFAGRSVLLVLSDGDGRGALAMQLVDPAKGSVRGEAIVPSVHSSCITCIAMDPIGTAAGHGGVGGELAILGSADGGASIWRFMSSHYLPLRPRVRMRGHGGAKVHAVALSSSIHVCATVSENKCCIYSVGNGGMIRSFPPPNDTLHDSFFSDENTTMRTVFADTPALCLSVQGFLVCVCKTTISSSESSTMNRTIMTLHLFSLEGVSLGSKALESWRGVPHKISCTPDGTAIFVCSGRGITIHRLSAVTPLEFIDEWHITEKEELNEQVPTAWDVDFGPSILRPVVGAAACSAGTLRLHALPGITQWTERHKKSSVTAAVGQALAKPAQRFKKAMGKGLGLGSKFVGMGKEIGKEVSSDVKERGVGGFLGGVIFRKNQGGG